MQNQLLSKKLKEFRKFVKTFVMHRKSGEEEVHMLRIKSRELYSLISKDEPFYVKLKKVIKLSNKIRDMDVFVHEYLTFLAKKKITVLDTKSIKKSLNKKREKKINQLYHYLKFLTIPDEVKFVHVAKTPLLEYKTILTLNQSQLHKYRIYIKKRLYIEKNSTPMNEKKVKALSKIKDLLGTINDNYNGLKRLGGYKIKPKKYREIGDITQKRKI